MDDYAKWIARDITARLAKPAPYRVAKLNWKDALVTVPDPLNLQSYHQHHQLQNINSHLAVAIFLTQKVK